MSAWSGVLDPGSCAWDGGLASVRALLLLHSRQGGLDGRGARAIGYMVRGQGRYTDTEADSAKRTVVDVELGGVHYAPCTRMRMAGCRRFGD